MKNIFCLFIASLACTTAIADMGSRPASEQYATDNTSTEIPMSARPASAQYNANPTNETPMSARPLKSEPYVKDMPEPPATGIDRVNNSVYLAAQMTWFDYTEYGDTNEWLDDQSGYLWGGRLGVTKTINQIYLNAQVYITGGDTDYYGNITDGNEIIGQGDSNGTNSLSVINIKGGYTFDFTNRISLTPFVELGYRFWHRVINDTTFQGQPVNGITEDYTTFYASGGLLFQMEVINDLVLGLEGSIGGLIAPTMTIKSGQFNGESFDQGSSAIYEVGLNGNYFFTENFSIMGGVEFTYFEFGKSNTVRTQNHIVWEPRSETYQVDVFVGAAYSF
jgi:hypothetical protein